MNEPYFRQCLCVCVLIANLLCIVYRGDARQPRISRLGKPICVIKLSGDPDKFVFSPDGKRLASSSSNWPANVRPSKIDHKIRSKSTVSLWNARTGKLIRQIALQSTNLSLAFSQDGKTLVGWGESYYPIEAIVRTNIWAWDVNSGRLKHFIAHYPSGDRGIAFSPDSTSVAVGDTLNGKERGQVVILYDAVTWKRKDVLHGFESGAIVNVAYSPNGTLVAGMTLASESMTGELCFWDRRTGKRYHYEVGYDESLASNIYGPYPLFFLSDGTTVVCGNRFVNFRNPHSRLKPTLPVDDRICLALYSRSKNEILFAAGNKHKRLELWDVARRKLKHVWQGLPASMPFFAFSQKNNFVAVADGSTAIQLWHLKSYN